MNLATRDMLISRVVGGEACDEEWEHLTALAEEDPTVWRDVAESQRDATALEGAVDMAGDVADTVVLPAARHGIAWSLGSWGGWAIAAAVALAWLVQFNGPGPVNRSDFTQTAGLNLNSAADAIQEYLDQDQGPEHGEVIGELPTKLLVDSRPNPTGQGYELVYVRQVLERTIVVDLYQFTGEDEWGKPTLMKQRRAAPGAY